jgi:membrane-associated phospholipid phosphatase
MAGRLGVLLVFFLGTLGAQTTGQAFGRFAKDYAEDLKWMGTAPFKMGGKNFTFKFVPIAATTTALTYGDYDAAKYASQRPNLNTWCKGISEAGSIYTLAGLTGGAIIVGAIKSDNDTVQMGRNAALALAESATAVYSLKYAFGRERPYQNLDGRFFKAKESFPSGHSMMTFAVAAAIAHHPRCPKWLAITGYAAAATVSVARWGAFKHFPSDAFAGAALGYFIGTHAAQAPR